MEKTDYIDNIKTKIWAGVLEPELGDEELNKILDMSVSELNRYYNMTALVELPATSCIDLKEHPEISTVVSVFRTEGVGGVSDSSSRDPVAVSQLQMYNAGSTYYSTQWIYNYINYALNQKLRNSMSTDLEFREDKIGKKLYINYSNGTPTRITIEYIPRLMDCSQVCGEYWEDILNRLFLAHSKIAVGRIRTRFTQSNAIWEGDGANLLQEGNSELDSLREQLRKNTDYILPMD